MIYPPWDSSDMINNKYEVVDSHQKVIPNDSTIPTTAKVQSLVEETGNSLFEYDASTEIISPSNPSENVFVASPKMMSNEMYIVDKLNLNGNEVDNIVKYDDSEASINDHSLITASKTFKLVSDNNFFEKETTEYDFCGLHISSDYYLKEPSESCFNTSMLYTQYFAINDKYIDNINNVLDLSYSNFQALDTSLPTTKFVFSAIDNKNFLTEKQENWNDFQQIDWSYKFKKDNTCLFVDVIYPTSLCLMDTYVTGIARSDRTIITEYTPSDDNLCTEKLAYEISGRTMKPGEILVLGANSTDPNVSFKERLVEGYKFILNSLSTIPITILPWGTTDVPSSKYDSFVQWRIVDNVLEISLLLHSFGSQTQKEISYDALLGETDNTFFSTVFQDIYNRGLLDNTLGFSSSTVCYPQIATYEVNQQVRRKLNFETVYTERGQTEPTSIYIEFFSDKLKINLVPIASTYSYWSYNFKFKIYTYDKTIPKSIIQKATTLNWEVTHNV